MLKDKNLNNAEQGRKKTPSPWRLIAPTLLSLGLCVVCLFGATWAWFTARVDGDVAEIQTASFAVDVQKVDYGAGVSTEAEMLPITVGTNGTSFQLEAEKTYQVTMKANANNTAKSGYCMVSLAPLTNVENGYATVAITAETELTFYVRPTEGCELSFMPVWGAYKGNQTRLTAGCLLTQSGIDTNGVSAAEDMIATTEPTTEPSTTESTDSTTVTTGTTAPTEAPTEAPTVAPTEQQTTVQTSESAAPSEEAAPAD